MERLSPLLRRSFALFVGLGLALSLLASLCSPASLWAMESRQAEQITVSQDQVVNDDLYVFGSTITIDGTIQGDLIGAGRQITLNGTVEGDLIAAGQTIVINGTVADDVRVAGQILQLGEQARISDDVVAAGASLETAIGSEIGGDLSYGGAQALLAGAIQQSLRGAAAGLELRGTVGENVTIVAGEMGDRLLIHPPFLPQPSVEIPAVMGGLAVTDSAQIGGSLSYRSPSEASIASAATIAGGVNYDPIETATASPLLVLWGHAQRWISLLIVGVLLLWLKPGWLQQVTTAVQAKPLPSLGWGAATVIVVGLLAIAIPVATILLSALVGSVLWNLGALILGLGLLTNTVLVVGFFLFIGCIPAIALSLAAGQRLLGSRPDRSIGPLALGLFLFVLLTAIPIVGVVVYLVTVLLGVGAVWIWRRTKTEPEAIAI